MKIFKIAVAVILLAVTNNMLAQVSSPSNLPGPTNYVGFSGTSSIPLPIANIGDPRIHIRSNGFNKITINELPTWIGLNGAQENNASRITLGLNGEQGTAWSMLHLWNGGLTSLMRRDWFNVGTTYIDNADLMHSGLMARPNTGGDTLATDAVIAWGCQYDTLQNENADNFRFIFLRSTLMSGTPTEAAQTQQGQEMMRISPVGNVGIGDFSSNGFGLAQQPTHTLDVIGTARLRGMPTDTIPDVIITGVQQDATGDYELNYIPFTDLGGEDCRWTDANSVTITGETDMYTAYDPDDDCYRGKVGIGVKDPDDGKLEVWMISNSGEFRDDEILTATYSRATAFRPNTEVIGVNGVADSDGAIGSSQLSIGVNGIGTDSRYVCGVRGQGIGAVPGGTGVSIGVWGDGINGQSESVGIYGTSSQNGYAGYFAGPVAANQSLLSFSDESLKTDVNNIDNATDILNQLVPRTYYFLAPESNPGSFPDDMQYGLIAQEVQTIIPDIVHETFLMPARDSTGFVEDSEVEVLGVEYSQLIPILIQGFNEQSDLVSEQQGLIQDQNDLIESMEETISEQAAQMEALQTQMQDVLTQVQNMEIATSNCCIQKSGTSTETPRGADGSQEMKLGQNVPNPFTNQTRIDFELPFDAQVILEITDGTGRPIQTLIDGQMSTGMHSTTWDGSDVAPGMYYYTLYANGELLSKKMIKR